MKLKVNFRKVNPKTYAETISKLHWSCFGEGYELPEDGHWWLGFTPEGKPVAFCGIQPSSTWADSAYLCRAGVLRSHRGLGLQRRMIKLRERWAKNQSYDYMLTDTRDNPVSSNNLIACGFRIYDPHIKWAFVDSIYWFKKLWKKRY